MTIVDIICSYLPAKRKQTPSGWIKFNAVCCHHNGTSADTRQRGGVIRSGEDVSYHCFNCGFKASYQPGRHLSRKMRQLLGWLGAPDDVVNKLALEAMKIESDQKELDKVSLPVFLDKPLPEGSRSFEEWRTFLSVAGDDYIVPEGFAQAVEYICARKIDPDQYPFYWSDTMPDRVIIPFYYEGRIVGYTARKTSEGKPKYLSEQTPGYVFNLDRQRADHPVIVVEGPMDAIAVNGVALLGAEIMDKQAMLINRLGKEVILVPDRDKDGARTVEQAVAQRWSVSMPTWPDGVKDCQDAVRQLGELATAWMIMSNKESSELKIKLRSKQWFQGII